jgi:membrane peptidoglycan carboxypeptidase
VALLVILLASGGFLWLWVTTPAVTDLSTRVHQVDQQNQASYTPLAQISPLIQQALIVTEDEHFYQHHGIDILGVLRAGWDDLLAWKIKEGGSTLTEQVAKEAYLGGDDHSLGRKLEDMALALKIEQRYSKSQILEFYLNLGYFGHGAYGIGAASERYLGRAPAKVDLAQAALLAGLVQAPSAYDPLCHPTAARTRQQDVLGRLLASGAITATQAAAARAEILPFWAPGFHPSCGV